MISRFLVVFAVAGALLAQQAPPLGFQVALGAGPFVFDTAEGMKIRVSVVTRGLSHPFSIAVLPDGVMLVNERGGAMRVIRNGVLDPQPVAGVPKAFVYRSAGLLDIAAHPRFAENKLVYFTYSKAGAVMGESAVVLARARWDGKALVDATDIYRSEWSMSASGSRIAFGQDGMIYMTTGAPFDESAQNLGSALGKILRLTPEGAPAPGNPFVGRDGTRPEIFSYGHRDQLGLTVHPSGAVLAAEHGPNGGDEVNLILPGKNYGWPISSYGRTYQGPRQSEAPWREGIEQPLLLWIPSIAPSGLAVYTGDRLTAWKGNLFAGSSREGEIPGTGHLERVVLNDKLEELRREALLTELHQRIRDVRQGPDGLLYLVTDENDGAVLRIEPVQ